jgi:pimeloyl-ACP methyl ester carboxylesterase
MTHASHLRIVTLLIVVGANGCMPPSWGAAALLHPAKRLVDQQPNGPVERVDFRGDGVVLKGWWFHASAPRKGTVVYLHGVGDNRGSSVGIAAHFVARGFDVIAYDSRAHGESEGDACTYGFYERKDVSRVLDKVEGKPIILLGTSLGAAVALQTAAEDQRVAGVIAVAAFSDLRTVASERAPFFASKGNIEDALRIAEEQAHFRVDDVSPVAAAARIHVPTTIIHGDHDVETPAEHSKRIFAALHEPKRLLLVPNRGHHDALTAEVWRDIDAFVDGILNAARNASPSFGSDAAAPSVGGH